MLRLYFNENRSADFNFPLFAFDILPDSHWYLEVDIGKVLHHLYLDFKVFLAMFYRRRGASGYRVHVVNTGVYILGRKCAVNLTVGYADFVKAGRANQLFTGFFLVDGHPQSIVLPRYKTDGSCRVLMLAGSALNSPGYFFTPGSFRFGDIGDIFSYILIGELSR